MASWFWIYRFASFIAQGEHLLFGCKYVMLGSQGELHGAELFVLHLIAFAIEAGNWPTRASPVPKLHCACKQQPVQARHLGVLLKLCHTFRLTTKSMNMRVVQSGDAFLFEQP